jgi:hypothetical protein
LPSVTGVREKFVSRVPAHQAVREFVRAEQPEESERGGGEAAEHAVYSADPRS